ncbi:probable leucine-rich repeat receptor-like protein kinase At1g35710 [Corylus avellana]|uniref:probable leucine-rich repeat receptor-like protein kinase At1g35710 n=1 Tax=Corylus avellana TaxID=13451 RepID=UPI00286AEAC2|nr:probable leucine-rich repeat receptor-like protein kinase At1g35710 [Corylus avellana]
MAPSVSIYIVVVAWATCILLYGTYFEDSGAQFVGASESSPLQLEAKALLESGWWNDYSNDTSSRCKHWPGITCNVAGSVTEIYLFYWQLNGDKYLKFNFLSSLPNLVSLVLPGNSLQGSIPSSLLLLTNLTHLDLRDNQLNGSIPPKLGNLSNLNLDLSYNHFNGSIPKDLGNLRNLDVLSLGGNNFSGPIPSSLGLLTNLTDLDMSYNQINGFIASEIGMLKNLVSLNLAGNMLVGQIPCTLSHLTHLESLFLSSNRINGSIPPEIGNMENLIYLHLENNSLNGYIPREIGNLKKLVHLILESNNFGGSIPTRLTSCSSLEHLILSNNSLSGSIPYQIRELFLLSTINLSHNFINGQIPLEVGDLAFLAVLDLSYNNLSGNIPLPFTSVAHINLSYNSFVGQIPSGYQNHTSDSLIGNKDLCGDLVGFPPCLPLFPPSLPLSSPASNKSIVPIGKIVAPISIFLGFLVLGGFCLFLSQRMINKTQSMSTQRKNGNLFSIWNYDGNIAYEDIIQATDDFDIKYCIGTGGYGSVYKAKLPSGKIVALKKLHRLEAENPTFDKSFKNEIKVLTEIRHRNIIKLYGFCLHKRCMFLVYEYKERGSLFCVLNNDIEAVELDWSKRVNIIKGTAHALSYMHHECIPAIVHRDISSNNILLNNKLEAFVSDFGTAKLLDPDSSNQTLVVGTYGYIAPGELFFSCYNLHIYLLIFFNIVYYSRT